MENNFSNRRNNSVKLTIEKYYLAFNVAYKDKSIAEKIVSDYYHKGEKVKEVYVIIEDNDSPSSFVTDNNWYHYFYKLEHAIEEINELKL